MQRIIYASNASHPLMSAELDQIAASARKNNAAENITGLLLYGDQSFFQVLEGPEANIETMKERIWNDPRHRGIAELQDKAIEKATFPDWSMGCYRIDSCSEKSSHWPIVSLESIVDHLPPEASPEVIVLARTFFKSIVPAGMGSAIQASN